jgi:hypothetical protein
VRTRTHTGRSTTVIASSYKNGDDVMVMVVMVMVIVIVMVMVLREEGGHKHIQE